MLAVRVTCSMLMRSRSAGATGGCQSIRHAPDRGSGDAGMTLVHTDGLGELAFTVLTCDFGVKRRWGPRRTNAKTSVRMTR
jgi:hypothetical protein